MIDIKTGILIEVNNCPLCSKTLEFCKCTEEDYFGSDDKKLPKKEINHKAKVLTKEEVEQGRSNAYKYLDI